MKPIYKFNNGNGAMLCNSCRTIISTGPKTQELLCEECGKNRRYYLLMEDEPCWMWSREDDNALDWNIIGYNSKVVSPRKEIPEENIQKDSDKLAIEFAEWLDECDKIRLPNGNWIIKLGLKAYTSEEVLEIFKKEIK